MPINKALAEYLDLYHKGEANAVTSRELECAFRMRGSELRREINALRGEGIPICSFDGGYYQVIHAPGNALLSNEILPAAEAAEQGASVQEISDMAADGLFGGGPMPTLKM